MEKEKKREQIKCIKEKTCFTCEYAFCWRPFKGKKKKCMIIVKMQFVKWEREYITYHMSLYE